MTPSTEEVLVETLRRLFPLSNRPSVFTDRNHCEECSEHDDTLQGCDPEYISLDEVGNPGWDPICFINPQGFLYFMSGLARLALVFTDDSYYIGQFIFHLNSERIEAMTEEQKEAVHDLLCYIRIRHKVTISDNFDLDQLSLKILELT
jgi:hypothetical protein